ncbi:hypothetical protein FQN60_018607, partial [Etheostoma spectabile]
MTEATALSAIMKATVGIYVTKQTPGNDFSDVGIIIEGVVVLQDWTAWPINSLAVWTLVLFEHEVSVTAPLHFEGFKRFNGVG